LKTDIERALDGIDVVVHAAAALPLASRTDIFSTTIDGTRLMLERAIARRVQRFIYTSSAEHMNLPIGPEQMASNGSTTLGYTEMKGSWFIFDTYRAHEDWCRWRAPFWHGTRVMDPRSHANYHLGFRCCKTLPTTR